VKRRSESGDEAGPVLRGTPMGGFGGCGGHLAIPQLATLELPN
jgi:hypothetical protein